MFYTDIGELVHVIGRKTSKGIRLLGTAFFINKAGILASAAHVTEYDDTDLVMIHRLRSIQDYQDTSDKNVKCTKLKIKEINPLTDVCLLESPIKIQSQLEISSTDAIHVGESVSLFGFPHCDHERMVLTQQDTIVGAKILIDVKGIKTKNIVLNIQARPGQSGSPVISSANKNVAAILIGSYAPISPGRIDIGVLIHKLYIKPRMQFLHHIFRRCYDEFH